MEQRLSMWTDIYGELPPEEALARLLDSSFRVFEFACTHLAQWDRAGGDWRAIEGLAKRASNAGARFYQLNAPIMGDTPLEIHREKTLQAIEVGAILGARWVVVHPLTQPGWTRSRESSEEWIGVNLRFFEEVVDLAQSKGVGIAVENLGETGAGRKFGATPAELMLLLDQYPADLFGVCWDTSHGRLNNVEQAQDIAALKRRIVATHISDNLGLKDDHLYPYRGTIDWGAIVEALSGLPWVLNFEVGGERARCPLAVREALVEYGYALGQHLLRL